MAEAPVKEKRESASIDADAAKAEQELTDGFHLVIDALKPGLRTGQLVIDCSTVGADTARTVAKHLAGAGVEFLDCPVSGGVEGAREATLAIMCGGSAASFTRAQPVLAANGIAILCCSSANLCLGSCWAFASRSPLSALPKQIQRR